MKKASMQLSINMIVILIIAVVILGLALGFVQNMFGRMSMSFEEQASNEPSAPSATPSEQLTMSRGDTILTNPGEELIIKWSVYCTDETNCEGTKLNKLECSSNIGASTIIGGTSIESNPKDIVFGSSTELITLIAIPKNAAQNKYLCTATVMHGADVVTATKDIIINVM